MKQLREILGYLLGGVLFVGLMPTVMWLASGMPPIVHIGALRASITGLLMVGGLALSVWTIVYMKRRGKGNPSGTLLYLAGVVVWLWTWQAAAVWVAFLAIMMTQVVSEERRLHRDFGEEYDAYRHRTRRF